MPESIQSRLGDPKQTLYLIDISSFIFRAFYAIRKLSNRHGEPTNAIYGVATMLARLADEAKPEHLAVIYDSKEPSIRKKVYAEYKANRTAAPDELVPQFDRIEQMIKLFGIQSWRQSGIEADDLIATLSKRWCEKSSKHRVIIVSGDKDLMQLINDKIQMWDMFNNKIFGAEEVEEKLGIKPEQVRDYLGLVGDSSDNIPGVPGIGPKGAVDLLKEYGDMEHVLKAAEKGKIPGKKGEALVSHEKDARISAQLATVDQDLDADVSPGEVKYRFHVNDQLIELFKELDFHKLVEKWANPSAAPAASEELPERAPVSAEEEGRFRLVNTEKDFKTLLHGIEKHKEFGFDIETTSLNPRAAELVGVAICYDPDFAFYIPVGHRGTETPQLPLKRVLEGLRPFLEDPRFKKIGQNLKYDFSVMREMGLNPQGIGADTMVAAYVLQPEGRHDLQTLAAQYLDYNVVTYEQVCGKGKDQIGFDLVPVDQAVRYSAEDAWIALRLWNELRPRLEKDRLMEIFSRVDLPLVDVLSRMELQGVCIDLDWLAKLSKDFAKELAGIEERIQAFAKKPLNLNSTKQLATLLFEELKLPVQSKTKTGYSTDVRVLEALAPLHEVPRLLLQYREISKLKGTYVDPLPALRDAKTGKIHASFHQTVAATGRLSSSDPNLQNIPIRSERGRKIRGAFIPSEGNVFVSADYSQIELRLLAHMSGDKDLSASFQKDEDVHQRTASEIFGVKPEEVDDRQRGIAKAINFGLMYGKTAFGLSQELKIPRKEAAEIIEAYFRRYHGVKHFLDRQILEAKERGYVTTIMGRKRYLGDINSSNVMLRNNAERMAMNSPIQGTAADLMKLAMIELDEQLEKGGFKSKLIIQVHDEFVLDCPKKEAEAVRKLVTKVMENAMQLSVPLRVNSSTGNNWMEM